MTFSDHALVKMNDLIASSNLQVGSKYPGTAAGKLKTDCITFVREVLEFAFEKIGDPAGAKGVRSTYQKGTDLGMYLVSRGWAAYYWNPNVANPADGSSEHPFSAKIAYKTNNYYKIPLKGAVVDYKTGSLWERLVNTKGENAFGAIAKAKFGFGMARGGMHTFLISYGTVHEVHWDKIGADLYGSKPLADYEWLSGAALFPPDCPIVIPQ